MNITIPILDLIGAFIICIGSLILVIDGWRMLYSEKAILFWPMRIGLFFARIFLGEEEANRRKVSLTTPDKIKRNGIYGLVGGGSLLVSGLYLLVETINRIKIAP